jgi:hypothetical protein
MTYSYIINSKLHNLDINITKEIINMKWKQIEHYETQNQYNIPYLYSLYVSNLYVLDELHIEHENIIIKDYTKRTDHYINNNFDVNQNLCIIDKIDSYNLEILSQQLNIIIPLILNILKNNELEQIIS